MPKEKRFVEDYNEPDESDEESKVDFNKTKPKDFESDKNLESEEEEIEESEEDVQNIFEDNFGSFSPGFRSRSSSFSASLESEPVQNLERGLEEVPAQQQTQRTEESETPMMYNAPQYGSGYNVAAYEAKRKKKKDDEKRGGLTTKF